MSHTPVVYRGRFNDGGLVALTGALVMYGLVYSHLASILTSKAGIPSTPVYIVIIALGVIMASGVFMRRALTRSSLMIIAAVVGYIFILIGNLLFLDESAFALTQDRLSWAMVALSAIVLLSNLRSPKLFLLILRVVILASALIALLEFFSGFSLPVMMTNVPGRAAGLFENPNTAGLFLTMALPIVTIGLKPLFRAFWYALIVTTVFLTFSRGGLVLCGLAIILVEAFPVQRGGVTSLRRLLLCIILVVLVVALYGLVSTIIVNSFSSGFDSNAASRARLEANNSSDYRLYLLRLAWDDFSSSPFWGHGTGAGDRWQAEQSVHNMFGLVALEYGVIGLAWLAGFLTALWSIPKPFGIWAAVLFSVAALMTHNLIDGPTYALILATYAALPAIFYTQRGHVPSIRFRARPPPYRHRQEPSGHR